MANSARCLFCHRCGAAAHELGWRLRGLFKEVELSLLIDPFGVGEDIDRKVETLDFQALLFLSSDASLKSPNCGFERAVAGRRKLPVFALLEDGKLPSGLPYRLTLRLADPASKLDETWLRLGRSIRERADLYQMIQKLDPRNTPEMTRGTAKKLACLERRNILAEMAENLGDFYVPESDPIARYWIATALGHTGGERAKKMLIEFLQWETEPYPTRGIRDALEEIGRQDGL